MAVEEELAATEPSAEAQEGQEEEQQEQEAEVRQKDVVVERPAALGGGEVLIGGRMYKGRKEWERKMRLLVIAHVPLWGSKHWMPLSRMNANKNSLNPVEGSG